VRGARAGYLELGDPAFGHTKKDRGVADRQLPGEFSGQFAGLAGDLRGVALHFLPLGPQVARPGVKDGVTGAVLDVKIKPGFSAPREIFNQTDHLADIAVQRAQGPGPGVRALQGSAKHLKCLVSKRIVRPAIRLIARFRGKVL
jgi:hypothetical protein